MLFFWFCSITLYIAGMTSAQTVTLTSSVEQDGRQAACPGEVVTFTCMVTDEIRLRWIAEPFIPQSDPADFAASAFVGQELVDGSGQFRAIITDAIQNGGIADLTSELTVTISIPEAVNGTVVECSGLRSIVVMNKTLIIAAPPSPPQQPRYSVSQYRLNNFTVDVQWESPASDGGVGIDNYTLTGAGITAPLTVLSNEPLMTTLTLLYNEMHMVNITASNCAGEGTASVMTIHEAGCGPPTPPPRGSLGNLTSSQEGTVVTFQCNSGLVPSQEMMSVCTNTRWDTDPAELACRADCGDPSSPLNGFVMAYDSTLEGSQIVFQCSPGFAPSEQMMSVCMADGNWTPNPAELECSTDCGIPIINNGAVNYTTTVEGSTATYQCGVGLIPVGITTAVCMGNGKWDPDPVRMGCRLPGQATCGVPPRPSSGFVDFTNVIEGSEATYRCDSGPAICMANGEWVPNPGDLDCISGTCMSTAVTIGIAVAMSSISFTAGLLVALVIAYCYIRRQQKTNQYSPSETAPTAYEDVSVDTRKDIELKENVAYRVVGK